MPSLLPLGGTIRLNASPGGAATVVPLAEGGFAAVYRIAGGPDVFTLYDDNFNALTGEVPITSDDFLAPQAAAMSTGQFVVTWLDNEQSIEATIYNPDGSVAEQNVTLATPTDPTVGLSQPRVVGNAFGGFTVIWQDNAIINGVVGTVFVQSYDSNGDPVGDPITVVPPVVDPSDTVSIDDFRIAMLGDGTIVTAAQVQINGVDSIMYSVNGGTLVSLAGGDPNYLYTNPQITPLAGGGYVITYDFVDPGLVGTDSPDANWTTGGSVFTSTGNRHDFAIGTTVTTTENGTFAVDPSVITPLADGGFVVTFEPLTSPLGDGYLVDAQQFDAFGNAVGPVVLVAPQGFLPSVATSADGVVLDAYQFGSGIFLQAFNSAPTPLGPEPSGSSFGFNSVVSANSPGVAPLTTGGFVVVYQDADGNSWAQIYGVDRQPVASPWQVVAGGTQPVVASQTNGTFLVAWTTGTEIMGALYDNQGDLLSGPFDMTGDPSALPLVDPALNAMPDGGYTLAYETDLKDGIGSHLVTIQEFDGTGNAVGFPVSQNFAPTNPLAPPRIAALEAQLFGSVTVIGVGDAIVAAIVSDPPSDDRPLGILNGPLAAAMGENAGPTSATIQVSGGNDGATRAGAQVATLDDGNVIVVWNEASSTAETWSVVGQVMTPSGAFVGSQFNITTALPSNSPAAQLALSALPDGGFLVTYDAGNTSLAAQRFDASGNEIDAPVLMTGAGQGDAVTTLLSDGTLLLLSNNTPVGGTSLTGATFTLPPVPMSWTGSSGTGLGTAGNWDVDVPPDSGHTMQFAQSNGGTMTGTATADSATFTGTGPWVLSDATVDLMQGITAQSLLQIEGGALTAGGVAAIGVGAGVNVAVSSGAAVSFDSTAIGTSTGQTGTLTLSGVGTSWTDTGSNGSGGFQAGGGGGPKPGVGTISVSQGALLTGTDVDVLGGAAGSSGTLSITNGGTVDDGGLDVGQAGTGVVTVNGGTFSSTGSVDIGQTGGAHGTFTVTGSSAAATVSGALIVGDAGAGALSVLNGGTVSARSLTVGQSGGGGTVDLEGAGTELIISGSLTLGFSGTGTMTLGAGSTLQVSGDLTETASGQIVFDGGMIDPSTMLNDATNPVMASSILDATSQVTNNGTYAIAGGATLTVNTPDIDGSGGFTIGTGLAGLILNSDQVGAGQTINFTDTTGMLTLGTDLVSGIPALAGFAATINGFQTGDQLVIEGETIDSESVTGSVLDLFGAGGISLGQLTFATAAGANAAAADLNVSCFAAGTGIATTRGLVPVECVHPGDRVCTVLGGDTAEVVWVGRRTVDCTRHPDPVKVWPVRISAHAFGRGMPATDLMLSPDHAVFVDRVLIPIRLLVNGRTLRQLLADSVSYYHIELAEHDVLLANGMPAETYLETGDRSRFSNGGDVVALHPDFSARTWEMRGCAPLVQSGPVLQAVRRRLGSGVVRRGRRPSETLVPGTGRPR
jgi:collagen type I/II/III/V/XI/XXIV/XXVII alpha